MGLVDGTSTSIFYSCQPTIEPSSSIPPTIIQPTSVLPTSVLPTSVLPTSIIPTGSSTAPPAVETNGAPRPMRMNLLAMSTFALLAVGHLVML
ncbi:hypothetical protein BX600DRAFT_463783 [Xylariales sp. PMI_506]|nr:hypothetical protein BX600DRAFT_463783 [Xylariales sp. PMI_506]